MRNARNGHRRVQVDLPGRRPSVRSSVSLRGTGDRRCRRLFPADPPEGFDLLTAAPGVVTVTTGAIRGRVDLTIRVLDEGPSALAPGIWDTVEEIGFRALSAYTMPACGEYYPFSADGTGMFPSSVTAKGPGFYRVRAYERDRKLTMVLREDHEPATEETYLLEIWATDVQDEDRRRLQRPHPTLLR